MTTQPDDATPTPQGKSGDPRRPVNKDETPYGNRGVEDESTQPTGGEEFEEGDRGELSGRNLAQQREVRGKP